MSDDEDISDAFKALMSATEKKMSAKSEKEKAALEAQVAELKSKVAELEKEKESWTEDIDGMTDDIDKLKAKLKAAGINPDDDPDAPNDDLNESVNGEDYKVPLLVAPEWRAGRIIRRIKSGDRITLNNIKWIQEYSTEDRFLHALKFRDRVVKAYREMCLRFAKDHTLPTTDNSIPTDFEVVKHDLKNLATLNDHAFIRAMFKVEH